MKLTLFFLCILISFHPVYAQDEINQNFFPSLQIRTKQIAPPYVTDKEFYTGAEKFSTREFSKQKLNMYAPKEVTIDTNNKQFFTYNNSGQITEKLTLIFYNGVWNNATRDLYTYGTDGKIMSYEVDQWYDGKWNGTKRIQYQYFNSGNLIVSTQMYGENGQWQNFQRISKNINAQGFMVDSIIDLWNKGGWNGYVKVETTFSSFGMPEFIIIYSYQNGIWIKSRKDDYEYINIGGLYYYNKITYSYFVGGLLSTAFRETFILNSSGKVIERLFEYFNGSIWENRTKTNTIYSGNNITQSVYSTWEGVMWENKIRELYVYNNIDLLIQMTVEVWSTGTWNNSIKSDFLPDSYGNTLSCCNYRWTGSQYIPYNYSQYVYYNYGKSAFYFSGIMIELTYYNLTNVNEGNELVSSFGLMQNYPNPFNPNTTIKYNLSENRKVLLKLYNSLGEEIMTLVNEEKAPGSYNVNLDMNGFSSGVYFYKLISGEKSFTKKMILMK